MKKVQKNNGFTIIEVVLVLAIAGLIFLMVFIALPALQASQRDTARKNDTSAVAAAVTSYTSNNKGAFPTGAQLTNYVKNKSDNTTDVVVRTTAGNFTPEDGTVYITQKTVCGTPGTNPEVQVLTGGATRQFTVVTRLEAGDGTAYCLQN